MENEKFAECTFQPDLPKPYVPSVQKAEVSMNTAAILREDSLLRNKQEKEFAILKESATRGSICVLFPSFPTLSLLPSLTLPAKE